MGSPEKKEAGLRVGVMFYPLEFQYFESIKMHLPCVNHKFHVLKMINKNTYKNSWLVPNFLLFFLFSKSEGSLFKRGGKGGRRSDVKRDR